MFLPAPIEATPNRRGVAIKRYCDQRQKMARVTETLYMPAWSASTLIADAPEIEPIEDDHDLLLRDLERDILQKRVGIRLFEAVLAFNRGEPFDSTFVKGLIPHVVS